MVATLAAGSVPADRWSGRALPYRGDLRGRTGMAAAYSARRTIVDDGVVTGPLVLVASCDLSEVFDVEVDDDDEAVVAALRRAGAAARIEYWDDPSVDWAAADAVVIRSVWNYQGRRDDLVSWAADVGEVTSLFPDADVVRWNTHKSYLLELEDRGVPIVPTAWLGRGDEVDLAALATSRGWDRVVAKPAVGAGSVGLVVAPEPAVAQDEFAALVADHDVLVQPLYDRIMTDGERSVVLVDGRVSHGLHKMPAADEVRVQVEFGGRYSPWDVDRETARLAEWTVESMGVDPLFARVDLVPSDDGTWHVIEVELVEPALFVDWAPGSADRLARALLARLGGDGHAAGTYSGG